MPTVSPGSGGIAPRRSLVNRYRLAMAPATPEARQFALDRLDAVYLDMLRTVLDESSADEMLLDKHGGGS